VLNAPTPYFPARAAVRMVPPVTSGMCVPPDDLAGLVWLI
jgi:hypothetical protein